MIQLNQLKSGKFSVPEAVERIYVSLRNETLGNEEIKAYGRICAAQS